MAHRENAPQTDPAKAFGDDLRQDAHVHAFGEPELPDNAEWVLGQPMDPEAAQYIRGEAEDPEEARYAFGSYQEPLSGGEDEPDEVEGIYEFNPTDEEDTAEYDDDEDGEDPGGDAEQYETYQSEDTQSTSTGDKLLALASVGTLAAALASLAVSVYGMEHDMSFGDMLHKGKQKVSRVIGSVACEGNLNGQENDIVSALKRGERVRANVVTSSRFENYATTSMPDSYQEYDTQTGEPIGQPVNDAAGESMGAVVATGYDKDGNVSVAENPIQLVCKYDASKKRFVGIDSYHIAYPDRMTSNTDVTEVEDSVQFTDDQGEDVTGDMEVLPKTLQLPGESQLAEGVGVTDTYGYYYANPTAIG